MLTALDFSAQGRARVMLVTIAGTAIIVAISLFSTSYITPFLPPNGRTISWLMATFLPIVTAVPVFYFFANKLRQLAMAHHQLALVASQDSLTTCLNRGAFITLVDAYLSQVNAALSLDGAMLIVDADHFKDINDRFGHASGDVALKLIASTLKRVLRPNDLVGRVGGEEFAVFLPKANSDQALATAERIRLAIHDSEFRPGGTPATLSVSVGATTFKGRVTYAALFESADGLLYQAKHRGRNLVVFGSLDGTKVAA